MPPPSLPPVSMLTDVLISQLKTSGWYDTLRMFVNSSDFTRIIEQLQENVRDGHRFTPPVRDWFAPFRAVQPQNVKVVLIAQGPYSSLNLADGLALSVRQPGPVPGELRKILESIAAEFEHPVPGPPDLTRWAQQGVLLLNQGLTTRLDRHCSTHQDIWNPFFMFLLDRLTRSQVKPVYLLYGETTRILSRHLPPRQTFYCPQPEQMGMALHAVNDYLGEHAIVW